MSHPDGATERNVDVHRESMRIKALKGLGLLDTPPDPEIDRLTALTASIFQVPICLVSLVDEDRLWFKSKCGLAMDTYPRRLSFCQHVVIDRRSLVCNDLTLDDRFAQLELVCKADNPLRFYAGVPLFFDGQVVGTLCVMDTRPRPDFDARALSQLERLTDIVCDTISARQRRIEIQRERELFTRGPCAVMIWEPRFEDMLVTYRSENLATMLGSDLINQLQDGAAFESLIWPKDRHDFRIALEAHRVSRLQYLETSFRTSSGQQWLRQATYGEYNEDDRLVRVRAYLTDITPLKRLEQAIESTKERLFLAMESAQIATWDLNTLTGERVVSPRAAAMMGYRPDELEHNQGTWTELVHPFDRARLDQATKDRLSAPVDDPARMSRIFSIEYRLRHKDGHYIWVQSCGKLVSRDDRGRPVRIVGTLLDISERKASELRAQQQKQLVNLVNEVQHTFLLDKSLTSACNRMFTPLLRFTDSQFGFIGLFEHTADGTPFLRVPSISNISWNEDTQKWYEQQQTSADGMIFYKLDNLFGHVVTQGTVVCTNAPSEHPASRGTPAGHPVLTSFLGLPLRYDGRVVGMIGLGNRPDGFNAAMVEQLAPLTGTLGAMIHARAIEERRIQAEALLVEQATRDTLTGLLNRRGFFEAADTAVAQARRYHRHITLAVLDLDHFKQVNDTHGHAGGDAVLSEVSQQMKRCFRESDVLARLGGEEFVVLLTETSAEAARIALERLRVAVEALDITHGGRSIRVTTSIGACDWSEQTRSVDDWLAEADTALYQAKNGGRNRVCMANLPVTGAEVTPETPLAAVS